MFKFKRYDFIDAITPMLFGVPFTVVSAFLLFTEGYNGLVFITGVCGVTLLLKAIFSVARRYQRRQRANSPKAILFRRKR